MKFLAIDTSGKQLNVVAVNGEREVVRARTDCAMQHSVLLMDEIDAALKEAELTPGGCDFFACVTGPGSFTGIRIGIATVKGLALACAKKTLALTSFDCLAYTETSGKKLLLVDAGHGNFYACRYTGTQADTPAFLSRGAVEEAIGEGLACARRTRQRGCSRQPRQRRGNASPRIRSKHCICADRPQRKSPEGTGGSK